MKQETIALTLVALVALWVLWRLFVRMIAPSLAQAFLKKGHVGLAMKLKNLGRKKCCN